MRRRVVRSEAARGPRFWETKTIRELTAAEWESLCDGCAQCCLVKLEDEESGAIGCTSAVCKLLDAETCRCTRYPDRHQLVPDCINFDADVVLQLAWLPEACAYRLVAEGKPLQWWHPLVSGDPATVHEAGVSVLGKVVSEDHVHPDELGGMIVRVIDPKEKQAP